LVLRGPKAYRRRLKKRTHSVEDELAQAGDREDIGDGGKGGVLSERVTSEGRLGLDQASRAEVDKGSLGNEDESDLCKKRRGERFKFSEMSGREGWKAKEERRTWVNWVALRRPVGAIKVYEGERALTPGKSETLLPISSSDSIDMYRLRMA
jgi:hypothetical protein